VLLTKPEEWQTWLKGSVEEAIALQKPLPNPCIGRRMETSLGSSELNPTPPGRDNGLGLDGRN
jgi:putative SOS response-associated peptidase YedK